MVSIIIPVYNAQKYLVGCLDSILSQTYKDWELIIVDDGSSDNSLSVCKSYESKDERIRVIHQKNMGATRAREQGWLLAQGEWIMFVDADDTIPCDALENLASKIDKSTDIILGWIKTSMPEEEFLSIDEYRRRNIKRGGVHVGPVAHLYRKAIFSKEVFDIPREIYMGEDMLMNIRLSFHTDKPVKIVKKIVYNYFIENPNNTTNSFGISIVYEELFHQYRLKSIPFEYHATYMNEMIGIRLYSFVQYVTDHPWDNTWKSSIFFKDLFHDICMVQYPASRSVLLLLKTDVPFLRYLLVQYRKLRKLLFCVIKR